jgi:hypothetical protein
VVVLVTYFSKGPNYVCLLDHGVSRRGARQSGGASDLDMLKIPTTRAALPKSLLVLLQASAEIAAEMI